MRGARVAVQQISAAELAVTAERLDELVGRFEPAV